MGNNKNENPSRSEQGSKVVVGYTRKRVGSSTFKNDARDDNRSKMEIEIGSRRSDGGSRRGGEGDGGRNSRTLLELENGETSSQPGKYDGGRDDKSRKRGDRKGSSNNGEKDNDEITPVSNRHDDGGHNKDQAQLHEGIPEDPNDLSDHPEDYEEESRTRDQKIRTGWKDLASFVKTLTKSNRFPEAMEHMNKDLQRKGELSRA
ncbi:uncharacterized protein EAF02_008724 [Botrytis sinoallii]|uniref:uncharacterized protein n=1 Tax=Botrytis sinoallii TaxID=1463999 RepID=UPI0018FF6736|nr:uncharacterized protein EAF02_008724 [Botrytis sinoallii]KAF7872653.1 hypothetical protein EAF02_008724 [Botrytis sinoallii]